MLVKDNDLSQAKRLAFKLFVVWLIKVLGRKSEVVDIFLKVVDIFSSALFLLTLLR
ncbi:MAG: hypothetical protein ACJ8MO_15630 [Bacillus sp. (in: firmicutes)]